MKIGIHFSKSTFSDRWISYCERNGIDYKVVNCFNNNIIRQLDDCSALMWHHSQTNPKSILVAKQILFALEQSGKRVFPDFKTGWHFDDKLGQKYLLESIGAPLVPTYVFYSSIDALNWVNRTTFPKVFKLRRGAGSSNVKLAKNATSARKIIRKAFGRGINNYNSLAKIKDIIQKVISKKATYNELLKGVAHVFLEPRYSEVVGKERGYVYFQDFIPHNDHDIRIIVIDNKAFAIKRLVRTHDFRASGSGLIYYEKELFNEITIRLAFDLAKKLGVQCVAFDFVYDNETPLLLEISYGFVPDGYDKCPGYWTDNLEWIDGDFDPYGWMVDALIRDLHE